MLFRSRFASGSRDGTVRLWDGAKESFSILEGHSKAVHALSFSPDGSRLASSESGGMTVILWDGATGKCVATLNGHTEPVVALSFHGSRLASESRDKTVRLWDGATGDFVDTYTVPCGISISLGESKETSKYYIQGTLPNSNNSIPLLWFPADIAHITSKIFHGKSAVFGCGDGRVIIMDLSKLGLQKIA